MKKQPGNPIIKGNEQEPENYYENILAMLPGHIYWLNREGVYLGCNDNQARSAGLASRHEIVGKRNKDLPWSIHPNAQPGELDRINEEIMSTGIPRILEEPAVTTEGKKLESLSNKIPFFNTNGEVIGLLGITIDITEYTQKAMAEYLQEIIRIMPGHVYWKDKDGTYLGCNDLQAKSAGFNSTEGVIGKTDYEMPWKDQADTLRKIDHEVMKQNVAKTTEEPSTLADGTEAIFLSKKVPLLHKGEVIGILGISFDITEQKKIEAELIKTKTRLDGMTILGASIAHELRTPFASLNVTAKTLETKINNIAKQTHLPEENVTSLQHDVASIKKEVKASLTFIDMLLLNINPTINEAKIEDFSIKNCITDSLERFPFIGKQHELVIWNESKNPDFIVRGEQLLIIHVFFNLLKNALYYIAKARKGNIEITIKDHAVYFKDTGTGIDKEHLPHIFKRFFSKTYHGAGVGLTFCEWVMVNLGGKITCESEEGHYTLFTLHFPNNT